MKTYGRKTTEPVVKSVVRGFTESTDANETAKKSRITDFFFKKVNVDLDCDSRAKPLLKESARVPAGKKTPKSVQTFLNIGSRNPWIEPCECGFLCDELYPANSAKHKAFHNRRVAPLTEALAKYERQAEWKDLRSSGDLIVRVAGKQGGAKLEVLVNCVNDLMGATIQGAKEISNQTVYVYIRSNQVIGMMSTEAIDEAYLQGPDTRLLEQEEGCKQRVLFGVSRIWVSREHQRRGIARLLLGSIRRCDHSSSVQCDELCTVPGDKVAFSQPTSVGCQLAIAHLNRVDGKFLFYR